jgi:hypothetical protein
MQPVPERRACFASPPGSPIGGPSRSGGQGLPASGPGLDGGGGTAVASLIGTHLSPMSRSAWPVTEFVRTVALSEVVVW